MDRPSDSCTACAHCGAMLERSAPRCSVCGVATVPPEAAAEREPPLDAAQFALVHVADVMFLRDLAEHLLDRGIPGRIAPVRRGEPEDDGRLGLFAPLDKARQADALIDEFFETHMPPEDQSSPPMEPDPSACPGCGAATPPEAVACVSCGLEFPEVGFQCLVCGRHCTAGTRTCPGCRTDFDNDSN